MSHAQEGNPLPDLVSRYWWVLLVRGLFVIAFGILTLVWPGITVWALVLVFAFYALSDGVLDIAMGIGGQGPMDERLSGGRRVWVIILGLIGIAAGLVAIFWPSITAVALLWVIAFWAIGAGIAQLITAWQLRSELRNEWLWVLAGLLMIALGVILMLRPGEGALLLLTWIGVLAIAWGVALAILSFRLRSQARPVPA